MCVSTCINSLQLPQLLHPGESCWQMERRSSTCRCTLRESPKREKRFSTVKVFCIDVSARLLTSTIALLWVLTCNVRGRQRQSYAAECERACSQADRHAALHAPSVSCSHSSSTLWHSAGCNQHDEDDDQRSRQHAHGLCWPGEKDIRRNPPEV